MKASPWNQYVTRKRKPYTIFPDPEEGAVYVIMGDTADGVGCLLRYPWTTILVAEFPDLSAPAVMPTYRIQLDPWTHLHRPKLSLHPFAIPHLLVTEQVPLDFMLNIVGRTNSQAENYVVVLRADCAILQMLGVSELEVAFNTAADVELE